MKIWKNLVEHLKIWNGEQKRIPLNYTVYLTYIAILYGTSGWFYYLGEQNMAGEPDMAPGQMHLGRTITGLWIVISSIIAWISKKVANGESSQQLTLITNIIFIFFALLGAIFWYR